MKFYKCNTCGQIISKVKDTYIDVICCGEPMIELHPHINDSLNNEKHVPVCSCTKNKLVVKIGEIAHPMDNVHYIEWILIVTNKGQQKKTLKPGDEPVATFYLDDDEKVLEVFAYCNIHSLWKLDLTDSVFSK